MRTLNPNQKLLTATAACFVVATVSTLVLAPHIGISNLGSSMLEKSVKEEQLQQIDSPNLGVITEEDETFSYLSDEAMYLYYVDGHLVYGDLNQYAADYSTSFGVSETPLRITQDNISYVLDLFEKEEIVIPAKPLGR